VTKSAKVWEYRGIHRSISTVSLDPETGLIFVGDFSGFVHCLDAETGKVQWTHDMKAHMWGSTFVADGKVYVGDEDGDFVVLAAAKEKKVISETNVGAAVYGTPIVANGAVYLQSNTHLFAFADPSKTGTIKDEPQKIEIKLEK
jgi:outer membrane protein assembly factor BamB